MAIPLLVLCGSFIGVDRIVSKWKQWLNELVPTLRAKLLSWFTTLVPKAKILIGMLQVLTGVVSSK